MIVVKVRDDIEHPADDDIPFGISPLYRKVGRPIMYNGVPKSVENVYQLGATPFVRVTCYRHADTDSGDHSSVAKIEERYKRLTFSWAPSKVIFKRLRKISWR